MRYQVPQFIEVEDKIFGPLTLKQFIYLAGGAGLCLMFLTLLPLFIAIILALPVAALSLSLAFYEYNGRPLVVAIEHAFMYFIGAKLYLWKQRTAGNAPAPTSASADTSMGPPLVPKVSDSRLRDLAWSLNIKDQIAAGQDGE